MPKFALHDWEHAAHVLAHYFTARYFGNAATGLHWVADEIGGVWCVADYFFDLSDMVAFVRYSYSHKMMFEYYDYRLANYEADYIISIRDYKKLTSKQYENSSNK